VREHDRGLAPDRSLDTKTVLSRAPDSAVGAPGTKADSLVGHRAVGASRSRTLVPALFVGTEAKAER
jgi:hypothetical protein